MRANKILFWILTVFLLLAAAVYTMWSILETKEVEWVGTIAIALTAILSAFLAFYIGRVHNAQGGELPEDRLDSNIDDGDPSFLPVPRPSWCSASRSVSG
jgi:uncharacterized membrane protein